MSFLRRIFCTPRLARWSYDYLGMFVASFMIRLLYVDRDIWQQPRLFFIGWLSVLVTTFSIGMSHQLVYGLVARRLKSWGWPGWWAPAYHLGVILVATRIGIEISAQLHEHLLRLQSAAQLRYDLSPTAYVISSIMVLVAVLVSTAQERKVEAERRIAEAKQEALRAQLAALQARTNPHFLFNSLNSVASLIGEDPARAERAVEQLSTLFRYALEGSRRALSTLGEEFEIVRQYLSVEELRLGTRLRSSLEMEPALARLPVLSLLLQPLVENAIVHGIAMAPQGGSLSVRAQRNGSQVQIEIVNDGVASAARSNGSGGSLRELAERLRLRYDGAASLEHGATAQGYRVRIELPLEPIA